MEQSKGKYGSPGFTLVEIMVAMVIALIVMGGVYQTLVEEDIDHDRSEKILDMQNNARVALERIARDVRRTGFLGCGGALAANTLSNEGTDDTKIGKLTVADNVPSGITRNMNKGTILRQLIDYPTMALPEANVDYLGEALGFANNAPADHDYYLEGTDAITLVYLTDERMVKDDTPMAGGTATITLAAPGFDLHDILYITDCENYSLFQKTNGGGGTVEHNVSGLNDSNDLQKNYGQTALARVFRLATSTYFIDKTSFDLSHDDNNAARSIAANIEDLQFEFLFDEANDDDLTNDTWVTTLGVHSSKEVRAMRIWVLAMSEPVYTYDNAENYDYPSSPYCSAAFDAANPGLCDGVGTPASLAPMADPPDGEHRYRYLASTVVMMRNAGLK